MTSCSTKLLWFYFCTDSNSILTCSCKALSPRFVFCFCFFVLIYVYDFAYCMYICSFYVHVFILCAYYFLKSMVIAPLLLKG